MSRSGTFDIRREGRRHGDRVDPVLGSKFFVIYYIRFPDTGGYERIWRIQQDTAEYSGIQRDTGGYSGTQIQRDTAGYSGIQTQRDTAGYSGMRGTQRGKAG